MLKEVIGARLTLLRKEKKLTQTQLLQDLVRYTGGELDTTVPVLSSYEAGNRTPPIGKLILFAMYYDVSIDYLCGITDERRESSVTNINTKEDGISFLQPETIIPESQLSKFHGHPVFVSYAGDLAMDRWGILDFYNQRIVFVNEIQEIDMRMKLYSTAPFSPQYFASIMSKPLNVAQIFESDMVWVSVLSPNQEAQGRYNGWYTHNEDRSMLINCANGLTLPYVGAGISYNAFRK